MRAAPWDSEGALLAKDRRAPIGKGQLLVEKGVSNGFVSPHSLASWDKDSLPIPVAEHAWGSPRAFLKVLAA